MATPYRGYTEVPGSVTPDVPYRLNLALREIDADVEDLDTRTAAKDAETAGRLATLEAAAGFGQGMQLQDDAVNGLLNSTTSKSGETVRRQVTTLGPAAVLQQLGTEGTATREAFDVFTLGHLGDSFRGPMKAWGRALENRAKAPAIWVSLGSSTANGGTTKWPGQRWVERVAQYITGRSLVDTVPAVQALDTATARPASGVHAYNGAVGGTQSSNYLTADRVQKIKLLQPALITHMVGSNDYGAGVPLATYKTRLRNWMDQLNAASPGSVHLFIHQQPRNDTPTPVARWEEYGRALEEVAGLYDNAAFLDAAAHFPRPYMMPGAIMAEAVHMNEWGHRIMADVVAEAMGHPIAYTESMHHRIPFTGQSTGGVDDAQLCHYRIAPAPYPREVSIEANIYAYGKGTTGAGPEVGIGLWYTEDGKIRSDQDFQVRIMHGGVTAAQTYTMHRTYYLDANREAWVHGQVGINCYVSGAYNYTYISATARPA